MSVLEHEYEYSKTVVFNLEYTYPGGYTKIFQRYKHWGALRNQCQRPQLTHVLSKTDLPEKVLVLWVVSFQQQLFLLERKLSYLKILPNASSWIGNTSVAQRDNPRKTFLRGSNERAAAVSEPTTGWSSAYYLIWGKLREVPILHFFYK